MKTPREQAIYLYKRFKVVGMTKEKAITSALICVDEMLNVCEWKTEPYIKELKQEIENV